MFAKVLEELVPKENRLRVIEECFREAWARRNGTIIDDRARLQSQLATLQQRKSRTFALVQDGAITTDEFRPMHEELKAEIVKVEAALAGIDADYQVLDCDTALGYLEYRMYNQDLSWDQSDAEGKRRLAKQIFPSGITYS
jgi:adenylate kinase family enzyme